MIDLNTLALIFEAWGLASLIMLLLWLVYLYKGEPAIVDIGWGGSIGCATLWMYFSTPGQSEVRAALVLCFVLLWSLRLSGLLLVRMLNGQKDYRYIELSEHWKTGLGWKYFVFFQAQALSVAFLSVPIALSLQATQLTGTLYDYLGLALFVVGICGEVIADQQMHRFRRDSRNSKNVCNVGLWRYSRHPNYFFEWIIWMSYAVVAMNHPYGVVGWVSPAVILYSILKVTGIPPTEHRLLKSKGDAYREYQNETSAFVPMPVRRRS